MSSSHSIEQALSKAQKKLLLHFMALLFCCLLLVELAVGALFFYDLYQTEKKILSSMASEYQRILTYDSEERLIHVLEANPHRLIDNDITALLVENDDFKTRKFIAGDEKLPLDINLDTQTGEDKNWVHSFIFNPYTTLKLASEAREFWLVLDNRQRDYIAFEKWRMTFYAMLVMVVITALFTHRILRNAMTPLMTLGSFLERLRQGKNDEIEAVTEPPEGLNVINASVHQAIARLQHTTTTLNTTVDAIAHDIRTPLSRIMLSSQSALIGGDNFHAMRDALSDCSEHAMQASNMLTALMKLNDELMGKRLQQKVLTDVNDVVKTVSSWYEDVAEEKQISLTVNTSDNEATIQSDPDKLTQILVNLVDNAIKYTPEKGKVTLDVQSQENNAVAISVTDTGIGIDPNEHALIFERLYRVDSSRSNTEGYGLGLSLAAAMVNNLGGRIELSSHLGQGSTFTIVL